ncbi:fungal-specific transcription factor domain-containing protein [Penicillium macrosclerotiorum]|uniref:fungal-specific transcription factor domain-containing protein n=1 Tax=Penicillium macrosclerotiorum TaxID=303699 RepID=UPI0025484A3E|nr:fungal-specific transcription factor domain-containing protein [Penicillium macrosclerotiorum]KAJ5669276.1 fungal-specific transcription factor domain-containing protein [Penicillium macrosclerotiorum]
MTNPVSQVRPKRYSVPHSKLIVEESVPACLQQGRAVYIALDPHRTEVVGHVVVGCPTFFSLAFSPSRFLIDWISYQREHDKPSDLISDRKISCDLGRPNCQNCVNSMRSCQGYGIRLNWPEQGSRRLLQHSDPDNPHAPLSTVQNEYFINTLMTDVELFYRPTVERLGHSIQIGVEFLLSGI